MSFEKTPQGPKRLWLAGFFAITLVLAGTASGALWLCVQVMRRAITDYFGRPMAPVTQFFLDHPLVVMLFPLPWLLVAVFALIRGRMAVHQLVLFSSTLMLALGTLAITMAVFFTVPWLPWKRPDVPHGVFRSSKTLTTFLSASEITAERLHYHHANPQNPWRLESYDRDGAVVLTAGQVGTVQRIFTQESTYGWNLAKSCAPNYGVLLTAHSGPDTIRIALCFDCRLVGVYDSTDDTAKPLNSEDDFVSPADLMLIVLCKQLFPNDPEIQNLK